MRRDEHSGARSALNRRDFLRAVALGGGAAWLAACQSAPAAPSSGSGGQAATAAGPGAAAGAPVSSGEGEEWRALLAAARQEGSVVVIGPPGTRYRAVLADAFQKQFPDIRVDYTGSEGSQALPKVVAERQAGKYLLDVHIGGPTSPLRTLQPLGALDPLQSALVLPEVKDTSLWLHNQLWFMDNAGQYILCFAGASAPGRAIAYHTRQVDPKEVTSWFDLLQPKWKGKIASADPNIQGTMRGNLTVLAATPELGTDYIRKLYAPEREVRLSGDSRLLLDWIAQGQYAIGLGIGSVDVDEASRLGLPVAWTDLKESISELSAQFNTIMLVNQAPHPNAARVYINWVLSREGQIAYQKAIETPSLRMDVPHDGLRPEDIPDPTVQYEVTQHERYLPLRDTVQNLVKELAGAR